MEVIFVELEDPAVDSSGGIISYLKNLSRFMLQHDVKTCLIGVELTDSNYLRRDMPFYKFIPIMKKRQATNVSFIFNLLLKLPSLRIPKSVIIHSQRPDTLFPFVIFASENPKVCTLHGTHDVAVFHKKGIIYKWIYDFLQLYSFKKADMLISVDRFTMYHYIRKYPWLKDKIVVIPVGIDLEKFKPMERGELRRNYGVSDKEKVVMYVGRLEKEKNLELLIGAFPIVKNKVKDAKLILIGEGREKKRLNSIVDKSYSGDVLFWGAIPHDRIPEVLNLADVLVLCSLYEGSPLIVREALSCGLPIVSVDVGDVYKIIKSVKGCYISCRDRDELAKKIIQVLGEKRRIKMGKELDKLGFKETGEQTMKVYESLMKEDTKYNFSI